jgi:general secretion pathway protein G
MHKRRSAGFTLIEILVVVAILGIIVAISVVNYLNAIGRARQRRSMSDMRSLATAIESYATDLNSYPPASAFVLPAGLSLPTLNLGNARPYLQPTYMKMVPMVDGWNSWFLYGTTAARSDYALRSAGQGGEPQTTASFGPTTDFKDDIILVNGQFVQWPDGVQK